MVQSLILAAMLASSPADAEAAPPTWRVSVEADPLPFVLSGYSGIVNVVAPAAPRWRFGIGGFGISTVPQAMVEMNEANTGFGLSVPWALAANALYFFGGDRGGFFVGPLAMLQQLRLTHQESPGTTAEVSRLAAGPMAGYQWFPFSGLGAYLMPWVGVVGSVDVAGAPVVGARRFAEPPVTPTFALHLGYEFSL